jgi:hypothetical protein
MGFTSLLRDPRWPPQGLLSGRLVGAANSPPDLPQDKNTEPIADDRLKARIIYSLQQAKS